MNVHRRVLLAQASDFLLEIGAAQHNGDATWDGSRESHDHIHSGPPAGGPLMVGDLLLGGLVPPADPLPPEDCLRSLGVRELGEVEVLCNDLTQRPRLRHTRQQRGRKPKIIHIPRAPEKMGLVWGRAVMQRGRCFDGGAQRLHHGQERGDADSGADGGDDWVGGPGFEGGGDGAVQADADAAGRREGLDASPDPRRVLAHDLHELRREVPHSLDHKRHGILPAAGADGKIMPLLGDLRHAHPCVHPRPAVAPPPSGGLAEVQADQGALGAAAGPVPHHDAHELGVAHAPAPAEEHVQPVGQEAHNEGEHEGHAEAQPVVRSVEEQEDRPASGHELVGDAEPGEAGSAHALPSHQPA
mmetsp:Transcript_11927/g.29928  ORF Transcript_11927/g.29928 Transcript_11927/m.29928 type:complete len:357 (+) Transcript_11927:378-1448(+)